MIATLPTPAEVRAAARDLLEPLDTAALAAAGVLAQAGRGWWQVLAWDRLPAAASRRIVAVADGPKVRFEVPTPAQRQQLMKIAGR